MVARSRIAALLSLGALLVALTGCTDRELPTDVKGAVFTQSAAAPVVNVQDDVSDVDGCTDTHCSLREALDFAEPGATITFAEAVTGTVTLGGQLTLYKNVTISGPGAATLALSGNDLTGVFYVNEEITAAISGLTIRDAAGSAAIQNGGTLTITACVVTDNHSGTSYHTGGISNWGELTISGSTITGNSSDVNVSYIGGGISNDGGTLSISASTISGNTTLGYGAGINNHGGTLTITASTISGNSGGENGGGIYHEYSSGSSTVYGAVTVTNSTISGNTANYGGGIHTVHGSVTVVGTTISGNMATTDGGGVYSDADWNNAQTFTEVMNSTLSGNTAGGNGGGIYNYDGVTRIVLSTITNNHAAYGAGVWSYNDDITRTDVKGSLIWGNTLTAAPVTFSRSEVPSRGRTKAVPTVASLVTAGTAQDVFSLYTYNRYHSLGYNLIGAGNENVDFTLEFIEAGDQTGVPEASLGSLADNGGPTLTHALLTGSPAVDAGVCTDYSGTTVSTDQRGIGRPQGSTCDVGAYESSGTALPDPNFTFDLSTLAKTYGDPEFSVAAAASSSNSEGEISFSLGAGSVSCSVTPAGLVTLTGAATGTSYCVLRAYLTSDGTYASATLSQSFNIAKAALTVTADDKTGTYAAGTPSFSVQYVGFVGADDVTALGGSLVYAFEGIAPTSYASSAEPPTGAGTYSITPSGYTSDDYGFTYVPGTLTINKAAGSVSINNLPAHAQVGGSFTPTYAKSGDGVATTMSSTLDICTVDAGTGVVSFIADGDCTLVAAVAEGTNHLEATGTGQNFVVHPAFTSSCTYTLNRNGSRAVTVTWANAYPAVIRIQLADGRIVTKQMAPTISGSWHTNMKATPTYGLWGGTSRRDAGTELVAAGTCTGP